MRPSRLGLGIVAAVVVSACSDRPPPPLGDNDSSTNNDVVVAPCSVPTPTCPCPEAGVQESCGTVYHYSGSYVTCSKEYMTCGDDGTWGACVGPQVFNAD